MEATFNLHQHEAPINSDVEETTAPIARPRHPRETVADGFIRFVIIFGYPWVVFVLLSIHKGIALSEDHLDFPEHIFGIVNLLVFAKVLFIGKDFHLGTRASQQAPDKFHTSRLLSEKHSLAAFYARRVEGGSHDECLTGSKPDC